MNNLQKRILTSLFIFPLTIFTIFKGGNYFLFFLITIFFVANYELFSAFKKKLSILFIESILILSLVSLYYLRENSETSFKLLIWIILVSVLSDIGGYVFGKTFKWKKLTSLSPNKTLSGVIGSFTFSLLSLPLAASIAFTSSEKFIYISPKFFFLTIVFSIITQSGDLIISYFKRLENIKDTGKTLPGHGGIFDRVDGVMFVIILCFVLYNLKILP